MFCLFLELFNTIKKLIETKEISSYQINKDTGISYGNINAMRRGERSIENLS
ncbi:helix-turn-helix transcriptional regulator [Staphylococcus xylosus]|uniref:helix-turn-helix transcriptional regulator n=1 Tax=Staphylococcus xylosus TaxID=1288 RepID=UPI001C3EB142|nr:helix-turn-helix transcriptional regulator [Staphylococcus xylosus]